MSYLVHSTTRFPTTLTFRAHDSKIYYSLECLQPNRQIMFYIFKWKNRGSVVSDCHSTVSEHKLCSLENCAFLIFNNRIFYNNTDAFTDLYCSAGSQYRGPHTASYLSYTILNISLVFLRKLSLLSSRMSFSVKQMSEFQPYLKQNFYWSQFETKTVAKVFTLKTEYDRILAKFKGKTL